MKQPPNILFITDDQHRYDYLEMLEKFPVKTPNLAKMAQEGIWYQHTYSNAPLCMPARCSLHNGLYAHQHGMMTNRGHWDFNLPTVQQALQKHGYTTAAIGKLHVYEAMDCGLDLTTVNEEVKSLGYDFVHEVSGKGLAWYVDCEWTHAKRKKGNLDKYRQAKFLYQGTEDGHEKCAHPFVLDEEDYMDRFITDNVVNFLEKYDYQKPLFLWAGLVSPHPPFDATAGMLNGHDPSNQPTAIDNETPEKWVQNRTHYSAMVEEIDRQVGRMLDALENQGQLDNTLVVFTSDHGEMLGDHDLEGKCHCYDPSTRVPLLMRYPAAIKASQICQSIVELTDLPATLLDFAGITPNPQEVLPSSPGKSLVPTWQDKNYEVRPFAFSECVGQFYPAFQMIRDHRFKLVFYTDRNSFSLYNMQNDPDECHDLAESEDHADIVQKMSKLLMQHLG